MATKGDTDQGEGTGYKLKGGNKELGRYNIQSTAFAFKGRSTPHSAKKNFTPWKTKDFDKIMTDRTAVIGDSHGQFWDEKDPNTPALYSNYKQPQKPFCCECDMQQNKRYFRHKQGFRVK